MRTSNGIKFDAVKKICPQESLCINGFHEWHTVQDTKTRKKEKCKKCGIEVTYRKPINNGAWYKYHFPDFIQSSGRTRKLFQFVYGIHRLKRIEREKRQVDEQKRGKGLKDYEVRKEAMSFVKKYYI